ncbi:MAG: methyltransferase domain-containing protein [Candidatus Auribacterota bacterium]|nr:methyltransferase domain-containing protein [Candidatus Auribacterota bacterium]
MKKRELKYRINWQEAWKEMRRERMKKLRVTYDDDFFKKSAQDFSRRYQANNYESGRGVVNILGGILEKDSQVLEIGPGPGTLTVPLSEKVKKIVCLEASPLNVSILRENLREKEVENVELRNEFWGKAEIEDRFDLVISSHFLWQMEDQERNLELMEEFSRRYCVIVQPCGRDELVKKAFAEICGERYTGQFEPDAEYFSYVILREWSRFVDLRYIGYSFQLNIEEGIRYIASYLGKFIEVDEQVAAEIKNIILAGPGEPWLVRDKAVIMWWEPKGEFNE